MRFIVFILLPIHSQGHLSTVEKGIMRIEQNKLQNIMAVQRIQAICVFLRGSTLIN